MQASSGSLVGRTDSYRQLRTGCVQTMGTTTSSGGTRSKSRSGSRSIALESFVHNERDDASTDGSRNRKLDDSFIVLSYGDTEDAERHRFKELLDKESGWRRSVFHKGLLSNLVFVVLMVAGVALIETQYPQEGPRGFDPNSNNSDVKCVLNTTCVVFRIISGVLQRQYLQILSGFRSIILDILFDVTELQDYFSNRGDRVRDILQLNAQLGGLLDSQSTDEIIADKINSALDSPQGFTLSVMGANKEEVKAILHHHIRLFINDIAPEIYKRLAVPGITDGDGLKTEIKRILEPRLSRLDPRDVSKIVGAMLRKHLSWLIIWGNIFGATVGLLNEAIVTASVHAFLRM